MSSTAVTRFDGFFQGSDRRERPPKNFETWSTTMARSTSDCRSRMSCAIFSSKTPFIVSSRAIKKPWAALPAHGPESSGIRRVSRLHDHGPEVSKCTTPDGRNTPREHGGGDVDRAHSGPFLVHVFHTIAAAF